MGTESPCHWPVVSLGNRESISEDPEIQQQASMDTEIGRSFPHFFFFWGGGECPSRHPPSGERLNDCGLRSNEVTAKKMSHINEYEEKNESFFIVYSKN